MKLWKTTAIFSLLLWVATIAGGAFMFTRGITSQGDDGRTVVEFSKSEVEFTLTEMRGLLETIQEITSAVDENDMKSVTDAVKGKGVADMLKNTPKSILAKLPINFREMGMAMHNGFDEIGKQAAAGAKKEKIIGLLSEQLSRCTACHSSFSLPR